MNLTIVSALLLSILLLGYLVYVMIRPERF